VQSDPGFLKRVLENKRRMDSYTRSHEGKDLNFHWWGWAFFNVYKMALTQLPKNYEAAERILREGLEVLAGAQSDDALAVPHVKLELYESHIRAWIKTQPVECARVWDETGEWARGSGNNELLGLWRFAQSTVEPQLLVWADGRLKGESYAKHAAARLRVIAAFLANENVDMRRRSTALRCTVEHLIKRGDAKNAEKLLKLLQPRTGVTADYYYSRMLVSLFGEGDWEKATSTLSVMQRAPELGRPEKPSEQRIRSKAYNLYYRYVFMPGPELKRLGMPED
jgi:hypothetical protein